MNTLYLMLAVVIGIAVSGFSEYCLFVFLIHIYKRLKTKHINKNNHQL